LFSWYFNTIFYLNLGAKVKYLKSSELAENFKITTQQINEIFLKLNWETKEGKNWIITQQGVTAGGKQFYYKGSKYIKWNDEIKNNFHLKEACKVFIEKKENKPSIAEEKTKPKNKMTNKEKKVKGDKYEAFVANYFREQNYYVWEHGKEKGVLDSSIDLIVKKEKLIYFVQCKNWESWKINHKEVKATRTDVRDYLEKEKTFWQLIKNYQSKILYVTPKECLTKDAYMYIKENQNLVEYQVVPMNV